MYVLIPDLDEDRPRVRQQVTRDGQPIPQVCQIGVNAVAPGVAIRSDLLGLARDVRDIAILDVAAGGAPLKVAIELDPVRRIDVDALDLATQTLAFCKARHDLQ